MTDPPAGPSKAAKVWRRTRVGGSLALALGGLLWLSSRSEDGLVVLLAGWVLALAALVEVARMGPLAGRGLLAVFVPAHLVLLLAGLFGPEVAEGGAQRLVELAAVGGLALGLTVMLRAVKGPGDAPPSPGDGAGGPFAEPAPNPWTTGPAALLAPVLLTLWIAPALPWLRHVWSAYGNSGLVALIVLSKVGDIAGYYAGNALGKTHPFPGISPGKTTAGCVASLVTGIAVGVILSACGVLPEADLGLVAGALAGGVVNLASQAGDLAESWVKRRTGVKDSSTLFGPSGGFLDLIDSLLFSVPAALLTWPWLFGV